jgi:hypothetical protein
MNPTSPFSIEELKTQEERLEILSKKEDLSIGVPKEDPAFEKRVCLTTKSLLNLELATPQALQMKTTKRLAH